MKTLIQFLAVFTLAAFIATTATAQHEGHQQKQTDKAKPEQKDHAGHDQRGTGSR